MKAVIAAGALVLALGTPALHGAARAADAAHPYSDVNHSVDAGNNTGDSQTDQLNQQELQKVDPSDGQYGQPPGAGGGPDGQSLYGQQPNAGHSGGGQTSNRPPGPPGYPPPPYAYSYPYPPPYAYAPPVYAYAARPCCWRPWWGFRPWYGPYRPYYYWR
jgi:hypothetical protein